MKKAIVYLLISYFLVLFVSGCSNGGDEDKKAEKIVADRQMVMRKMSGSMDDLEKMLFGPGGDESNKMILEHALLLQKMSEKIPEEFSQKADGDQSAAKSAIWKDKAKFDQAASDLKAKVDEFVLAAKTGDKKIIQNTYNRLDIKSVCMSCHTQYRKESVK